MALSNIARPALVNDSKAAREFTDCMICRGRTVDDKTGGHEAHSRHANELSCLGSGLI